MKKIKEAIEEAVAEIIVEILPWLVCLAITLLIFFSATLLFIKLMICL